MLGWRGEIVTAIVRVHLSFLLSKSTVCRVLAIQSAGLEDMKPVGECVMKAVCGHVYHYRCIEPVMRDIPSPAASDLKRTSLESAS